MINQIIIEPQILRIVGPVPALVHAILKSNDSGDGAELAYSQIADAASISQGMARRAVTKLRDAELLTEEQQIESLYGQQANRYSVRKTGVLAARNRQPYMTTKTLDSETTTNASESSISISNKDIQGNREHPTGLGATKPLPFSWVWIGAWTPINSPRPLPANCNLSMSCRERLWLVSYMEGYVLDRENAARRAKGWRLLDGLPEKRRLQFLRDAEMLLSENSLSSVVDVIDWVFNQHSGWFPFDVIDSFGMKRRDSERKVTSLRKIRENFDTIQGLRSVEPVQATSQV